MFFTFCVLHFHPIYVPCLSITFLTALVLFFARALSLFHTFWFVFYPLFCFDELFLHFFIGHIYLIFHLFHMFSFLQLTVVFIMTFYLFSSLVLGLLFFFLSFHLWWYVANFTCFLFLYLCFNHYSFNSINIKTFVFSHLIRSC